MTDKRSPFRLQTPRLEIREFTLDMAQSVCRLSLDAANRRFLPDEVFESENDARAAIMRLIACYGKGAPLVYPVFLRAGAHIGHVEAARFDAGWEIGYHIGEAYTGRGYAAEAVGAFAPAIMRALDIRRLYGICDALNLPSVHVLEKAGFMLEYAGPGCYQGRTIELRRYCLTRV